ncbi:MAG TPA: translation initiation factor, partial [Candidatus Marinimicrobia bacterium]|nr:translation initiation factor [Candidatus Neomarinimicrobiota bacterium]
MNQDKKCNVVYSTDPNFENNYNDINDSDTIETYNQNIRIWIDRRGGGKILTVIKGFKGP